MNFLFWIFGIKKLFFVMLRVFIELTRVYLLRFEFLAKDIYLECFEVFEKTGSSLTGFRLQSPTCCLTKSSAWILGLLD